MKPEDTNTKSEETSTSNGKWIGLGLIILLLVIGFSAYSVGESTKTGVIKGITNEEVNKIIADGKTAIIKAKDVTEAVSDKIEAVPAPAKIEIAPAAVDELKVNTIKHTFIPVTEAAPNEIIDENNLSGHLNVIVTPTATPTALPIDDAPLGGVDIGI